MKKIVCIMAVVLMVASLVYAAEKKAGITAKDLPAMKGMWSGMLNFGAIVEAASCPATLEILTDAAPVKAKLTVQNMPAALTSTLGLQSGTNSWEGDGVLTTHGTILWTGPAKGFFELTKSGDKKAKVTFWIQTVKGDGSFTKK